MTVSNSLILLGEKTMLYCPKCRSNYQDGTQRFCTNDGGRLLPMADSVTNEEKSTNGVFTNLLSKSKSLYESDEKLADKPLFVTPNRPISVRTRLDEFEDLPAKALIPKISKPKDDFVLDVPVTAPIDKHDIKPVFRTSQGRQTIANALQQSELPRIEAKPKITEFQPESKLDTEIPAPDFINKASEFKGLSDEKIEIAKSEVEAKQTVESTPAPRAIQVSQVPMSQAELGDREKNPTGRLAISLDNPNVLLGQTIKGRYYVEENLAQDDSGISFLATDKLNEGRRVVVRVLMDDEEIRNAQMAEERVSLSHINHPHIASLFDSGELLEGRPFLVTEFVEGKSLRAMMDREGPMNPLRAARIVRQISYALSDAHHNGILHRNLKPESVMLGVSDIGIENVKVIDFCGSFNQNLRNQTLDRIAYWSPEQIEGKFIGFAADVYALAVIAYELLTGKYPFNANSAKTLLDSQKQKQKLNPSRLRLDLPEGIDEIIQKGLSYNPLDRYPRARDLGEALFNLVNTKTANSNTPVSPKADSENEFPGNLPVSDDLLAAVESNEASGLEASNDIKDGYIHFPLSVEKPLGENESPDDSVESATAKSGTDTDLWKNRSPEPPKVISLAWLVAGFIGLVLLIAGAIGIWTYYFKNQPQSTDVPPQIEQPNSALPTIPDAEQSGDSDHPPSPRTITPPEGFVFFQNSKQGITSPALLKKFRGFSLYYPKDWVKVEPTNASTYFVDVKKASPTGMPIEQIVIEPYASKGTYKEDLAEFPVLVNQAERELRTQPNYEKLGEEETTINNDRKVYEIRWVAAGETKSKEMITIWGRTIFMPAQRRGIKSGLRITMVASSLSNEVKSIDDVGVKGSLAKILETFEPDSLD